MVMRDMNLPRASSDLLYRLKTVNSQPTANTDFEFFRHKTPIFNHIQQKLQDKLS